MNAAEGVRRAEIYTAGMSHAADAPRVEVLPRAEGLDALQGGLAALLALMSALGKTQAERATSSAKDNQQAQVLAERELADALERARESGGGFFAWLEKDMGLLGVAGLVTFQYGLVAADLALKKSGLVDELKLDVLDAALFASRAMPAVALDVILRKLNVCPEELTRTLDAIGLGESVPGISDADVKPVVEKALLVNMLVAGAAASILTAGSTTALVVACIGLALSVSGSAVSAAGGLEEVALGLQIAGALCAASSGFFNGAGAAAATGSATRPTSLGAAIRHPMAAAVGKGVNGANAALGGVDCLVGAIADKRADEGTNDAAAARSALSRLERMLEQLLDALNDRGDSLRRSTERVRAALGTHGATLLVAGGLRA